MILPPATITSGARISFGERSVDRVKVAAITSSPIAGEGHTIWVNEPHGVDPDRNNYGECAISDGGANGTEFGNVRYDARSRQK